MEAKDTLNGQEPSWEQVTDVSDQKKEFLCDHVAATAAAICVVSSMKGEIYKTYYFSKAKWKL